MNPLRSAKKGISIGIIGPTLYLFEQNSISRDDELPLIFIGRALGFIAGWTLRVKSSTHNGINLRFGFCILILSNFMIPWASQIWWLMTLFFFQGLSIMIISKIIIIRILSYPFTQISNRKKELILLSIIIGCSISPLIVIILTPNQDIFQPRYLNHTKPVTKISHTVLENKNKFLVRSRRNANLSVPIQEDEHINKIHMNTTTLSTTPITIPLKQNSTVNITLSTLTTTSDPILKNITSTQTTNQIVHKPSIIDAKHLKQDTGIADGSNAASGMKKVDEKLRIVSSKKNDVKIDEKKKTSQEVITTSTPITTEKINSTNSIKNISTAIVNSNNKIDAPKTEIYFLSSENTTTSLPNVARTTTTKSAIDLSNSSQKKLQNSNGSSERTTLNQTDTKTTTKLPLPIISSSSIALTERPDYLTGLAPDPPFKVLQKIINRSFNHLHKIYIALSLSCLLISILFSLTNTRYLKKICYGNEYRSEDHREIDHQPLLFDDEEKENQESPLHELTQDHRDETFSLTDTVNTTEKDVLTSENDRFLEEGLKEVNLNSTESLNIPQSPFISIPKWPKIRLPNDVNLLMLSFLQTGLEVGYGGFLQSFTYVYLQWKYIDSQLVTTVFWLSNYSGNIICTFLLSKIDHLTLNSIISGTNQNFERKDSTSTGVNGCLRNIRVIKFFLCFLQLIGSLMCVIGGSLLVHFTSNPFLRLFKEYQGEKSSSFRDAYWTGSIFIGLGLGILRAVIMPTIIEMMITLTKNDRRDDSPESLKSLNEFGEAKVLSSLIGQMILPAITGYIHRKFAPDFASFALGSTTLFTSCILLGFSVVDLLQTIFNLDFIRICFNFILCKNKPRVNISSSVPMTTSEIVRKSKNKNSFRGNNNENSASKLLD